MIIRRMNPELALIALEQGGVFTAEQAAATGLPREARRAMVSDGSLREIRRNIFTPGEYWADVDEHERHRIEIAAALIARRWHPESAGPPTLAAGRMSAGFLHRLPLPKDARADERAGWDTETLRFWERRPTHVDLISADRQRRAYRAGVEVRPAALPPEHVVRYGVIPISNLARTAVDLMREATRGEAVMVADGALRLGAERAELEAVADFCRGWPNAVLARQAIDLADARAESPGESLARVLCIDHAFEPEPQVELYDDFGKIARVDLLLRAFRIVLEVDGHVKMLDPWCGSPREAKEREEARERRLWRAGWIVIRTTWEELVHYPEALVERIHAAMASAPRPSLTPRLRCG